MDSSQIKNESHLNGFKIGDIVNCTRDNTTFKISSIESSPVLDWGDILFGIDVNSKKKVKRMNERLCEKESPENAARRTAAENDLRRVMEKEISKERSLLIDEIKKKMSLLKSVFQSKKLFEDNELFSQLIYLVFFNIFYKELFLTKSDKLDKGKTIQITESINIEYFLSNYLKNVYNDTKDNKNDNLKDILLRSVRSLIVDHFQIDKNRLLFSKLNIDNPDKPLLGNTMNGIFDNFSDADEKDPEKVILSILRDNQFTKSNPFYKFLKKDSVIREDNKKIYLDILLRYFTDSIKKELLKFKFDYEPLGLKNITIRDIYDNPKMKENFNKHFKHSQIAFTTLQNKFEDYLSANPFIMKYIYFDFLYLLLNISTYFADLDKSFPKNLTKDELALLINLFNDVLDILLDYFKFNKLLPIVEDDETAARKAAAESVAKQTLSINRLKEKYEIIKSIFQKKNLFNDNELFSQLIYLLFLNIYMKELSVDKYGRDIKIGGQYLFNFLSEIYDHTREHKTEFSLFLYNGNIIYDKFLHNFRTDLYNQKLDIHHPDNPLGINTENGIVDDFSEEDYENDPEKVIYQILENGSSMRRSEFLNFLKNNSFNKRSSVIQEDDKVKYLNILLRFISESLKEELLKFKFDYEPLGLINITIQQIYNHPRKDEKYSADRSFTHEQYATNTLERDFGSYFTDKENISNIKSIYFNFLFSLLHVTRYIADLDKTLPTDLTKDDIILILNLFNNIFDILLEYFTFKKILLPLEEDAENAARAAAEAADENAAKRAAAVRAEAVRAAIAREKAAEEENAARVAEAVRKAKEEYNAIVKEEYAKGTITNNSKGINNERIKNAARKLAEAGAPKGRVTRVGFRNGSPNIKIITGKSFNGSRSKDPIGGVANPESTGNSSDYNIINVGTGRPAAGAATGNAAHFGSTSSFIKIPKGSVAPDPLIKGILPSNFGIPKGSVAPDPLIKGILPSNFGIPKGSVAPDPLIKGILPSNFGIPKGSVAAGPEPAPAPPIVTPAPAPAPAPASFIDVPRIKNKYLLFKSESIRNLTNFMKTIKNKKDLEKGLDYFSKTRKNAFR
jgi:hypothetical protein